MLPVASSKPNTFPEEKEVGHWAGSAVYNSLTMPSYLVMSAAQRRHGGQTWAEKKQGKGKSDQRAEPRRETPHGHQPRAGRETGPGFRALLSRESLAPTPIMDVSFPGSKAAMVFLFPQDQNRS